MLQPFAFGGEEGMESFDPSVKYRASLQNYLIDTGDEVILVDTDIPKEFPDMEIDEDTVIYNGTRITDHMSALNELGYKAEDISKILITHKHPDHTGEIRNFPNAKVYMSKTEAEDMELEGENIIPVEYDSGSYYNFEKSQKIAEGIYLIEAIGHTNGNSIVIAEDDGLFYMIHGDITYTDEALYGNMPRNYYRTFDGNTAGTFHRGHFYYNDGTHFNASSMWKSNNTASNASAYYQAVGRTFEKTVDGVTKYYRRHYTGNLMEFFVPKVVDRVFKNDEAIRLIEKTLPDFSFNNKFTKFARSFSVWTTTYFFTIIPYCVYFNLISIFIPRQINHTCCDRIHAIKVAVHSNGTVDCYQCRTRCSQ